MKALGIETSCDENSVAVVEDGRRLLSNVVFSQVDLHKAYGGVVPEVAARSHIEVMIPTVQEALDQARTDWDDIDVVTVAHGPGLGGSLLIGTLTARTLAHLFNKPLYGVHHALGHVYANFIDFSNQQTKWSEPQFPLLALIVSGGHSHLLLLKDHFDYRLLGQTRDDAVGEAFDKAAKILGLAYPGGPSIQAAAESGDGGKYLLPKAKLKGRYDFSFSGLKTALLRQAQQLHGKGYDFPSSQIPPLLSRTEVNDLAAGFQHAAVETLVDKTLAAYEEFSPSTVVIAGGVAANTELRRQLKARLPIDINYAPISLCTDNGAMIAALGYFAAQHRPADDPLKLEINPSLAL
jgi:N6-L-threonylcarbamoyladenine synthase